MLMTSLLSIHKARATRSVRIKILFNSLDSQLILFGPALMSKVSVDMLCTLAASTTRLNSGPQTVG